MYKSEKVKAGVVWMAKLADIIERYLRQLIDDEQENILEIKRSDIAQLFSCAPSQINYVLSTRFTFQRGYLVESRRGEGGFIRIIRVQLSQDDPVRCIIDRHCGNAVSQEQAYDIIRNMEEAQLISGLNAAIMRLVLSDENNNIPEPIRDICRAELLRKMILEIIKYKTMQGV